MSTIQHKLVTGADLHGIIAFSVASTAVRDALSVVAGDIGKVCQVTADNSFYILTGVSPATWSPFSQAPTLATVATSGSYADLTDQPTIPAAYTLPVATDSVLGGVKAGSGVTIDGAGVISAAGNYSLPTASETVLGGIKIGAGLSIDGAGVVTAAAGASLTATNTWSAGQRGAVVALTAGSTVSIDFATSNNFSLSPTQSFTLANPTNAVAGQSGVIAITQDGTGSRVISWGTNFKAAGGTKPVLTTTAGAVDYISYYVESATRVFVSITADIK